jgi:hypothetical protein
MAVKAPSLALRLLQRNGREKIEAELRAQIDANKGVDDVLRSTQERYTPEEYLRKVGTVSCVSRGHNPHDSPRASSRSSFYTWGGETQCDQQFHARTMRK